jgi:hypothetical protein
MSVFIIGHHGGQKRAYHTPDPQDLLLLLYDIPSGFSTNCLFRGISARGTGGRRGSEDPSYPGLKLINTPAIPA